MLPLAYDAEISNLDRKAGPVRFRTVSGWWPR
jgi:hypothetical protein